MIKKKAVVKAGCVACGTCAKACPTEAISVPKGTKAVVDEGLCVGCGRCAAACPAEVIAIEPIEAPAFVDGAESSPGKAARTRARKGNARSKRWYDRLYVITPVYLALGFFNVLFAWVGLAFFFLPLILAIAGKGKLYCNRYCDRGQFLALLGERLGLSRRLPLPSWVRSKAFRYGFLAFFMAMFLNMLFVTWLVLSGARELGTTVQLLWTFQLPWDWAYPTHVAPGIAQFAFGFYGVMLTSNVIGILAMLAFRPRAWCVFCPMGTMTQLISKARSGAPSESAPSEATCGAGCESCKTCRPCGTEE